ncbi:Serpin A3-1 [Triplophysa tibetana]|uniref:Thyroxine-binding globulin n=1 Tax=Triplophysa tibetana TaxID=1572043 RepID=A0A5A9P519_9TELE|nr:Serpin A3-1 [Triplophysa tibetana]KAA0717039.1 Serpin A3-1 [Triplophysa tibetana]
MERKLFLWICFLVIAHPVVHGDDDISPSTPDNITLLLSMNNDFGFRLYKSLTAKPEFQSKNIFFSPISVSMALSALSLGANGDTKHQLHNGIGHNSSVLSTEETHKAYQSFLEEINQNTGVEIDVGTALYLSNKFKSNPEFFEEMKQFYLSEGFTVDFSTRETVEQINAYVKEKTHGKIDQVVQQLNPSDKILLLTYIYFKGKWDLPFDPKDTSKADFHVDDKTTVPVQMMHKNDYVKVFYDERLATKVLALDYNGTFSLILALPDKSITELETAICQQDIAKWRNGVTERKVKIYVPKLSLKTSYGLRDILQGMGMTEMFSGNANFNRLSVENIFVSEVVHKAALDVDEEGTTAAAVTTISIGSSFPNPQNIYRFDRPFMLFIVDPKSSILFMGKIINPALKE